MPRGSLLRHMFKHGAQVKSRSHERSPLVSKSERPRVTTSKEHPQALSSSPTLEPPVIHVLPQITEEEPASAATIPSPASSSTGSTVSGSTVSGPVSVITVLDADAPELIIDPVTHTTRNLLYAAMNEATTATNAHIDTLETTLALLQAFLGFSETIDVLKREMQDKKKACETKLAELADFGEAVEGIGLPDDEVHLGPD